MARTCDCPKPPGGSITCSDDQLAICGYQDGQIVSGCFDQPQNIAQLPTRPLRTTAMNNWALGVITGEGRSYDQPITPAENAILRSGEYVNAKGEKMTFALPTKEREAGTGGMSAYA